MRGEDAYKENYEHIELFDESRLASRTLTGDSNLFFPHPSLRGGVSVCLANHIACFFCLIIQHLHCRRRGRLLLTLPRSRRTAR